MRQEGIWRQEAANQVGKLPSTKAAQRVEGQRLLTSLRLYNNDQRELTDSFRQACWLARPRLVGTIDACVFPVEVGTPGRLILGILQTISEYQHRSTSVSASDDHLRTAS